MKKSQQTLQSHDSDSASESNNHTHFQICPTAASCLTVYMMLKLLTQSFLTLNKNQAELIVFGGHAPLDELTQNLGPLACHHSQTVRNLRVSLVGSLNERTKL